MNMLLDTLGTLSDSAYTWVGIALLAGDGRSIPSILGIAAPIFAKTKDVSPEEAQEAVQKPVFAGARFLLTMVAGVAATISGLLMLYHAFEPGIGFMLIVAGVVVMQTEPIRLQIRDTVSRLVVATSHGDAAVAAATESLRMSHIWLVIVHLLILFAVTAAVLAF